MQTILGANGQIAEELTKELYRNHTKEIRLVSRNPKRIHETDQLFPANLLDLNATEKAGYEITIASPKGGKIPIDPESLKPLVLDKVTKAYYEDSTFMKKLNSSKTLEEVENEAFDLVYLAGGHGTMYDFPEDTTMQKIVREHFENDKKVAAICHGVDGLLNVNLSNGEYLIKDKKITGFNWFEESIAGRKKEVPFNLEKGLKERESDYTKAFIPMTSKVVVDENLITGQNPFSSKKMAKVVMEEL